MNKNKISTFCRIRLVCPALFAFAFTKSQTCPDKSTYSQKKHKKEYIINEAKCFIHVSSLLESINNITWEKEMSNVYSS